MRSFDEPDLLRALRDAGWTPEGASTVLGITLTPESGIPPDVELFEGAPSADWRRDHARLSGADPALRDRILATVAVPCAFAGLRAERIGLPFVACAVVGVHHRMACLHLVVTDPAQRRRGFSRRLIAALLAWAQMHHNADAASVQVDSSNAPALSLYADLGFKATLFDYAYWRAPAP